MRVAFIGDVHGHVVEFMRILRRLEMHGVDRIIQLGDLVDRGPASTECVRVARTWVFTTRDGKQRCLEAILGNHEENHLYCHYKRKLPFRDYIPRVEHPDVQAALTEADFRWLDRLPHMIRVRGKKPGEDFVAVHGGFHPNMKTPGWFGKQRGSLLCRIGYFGPNGEILKPYAHSSRFWANEYDGRFGLAFFGHTSHGEVTKYGQHAVAVDCSKYGRVAAVVVSTEDGDQKLACFYEDHEVRYKTSYEVKEPGRSTYYSAPPKEERRDEKAGGRQMTIFELDKDKKPSATVSRPAGFGETRPKFEKDEEREPDNYRQKSWWEKLGLEDPFEDGNPNGPKDW